MGKVYTAEQVGNGHVPRLGAHQEAAKQILDDLRSNPETVDTTNALVYGSTATGRADERSDLDLMVSYDDHTNHERDLLDTVSQIIDEAARQHTVSPEFKITPERDIMTVEYDLQPGANYTSDPLFATHLVDIYDKYPEWSHNQPIEKLRHTAIDWNEMQYISKEQALTVARVAVGYTVGKKDMFLQCYAHGKNNKNHEALQRALEAPKAMGRKVLALLAIDSPAKSQMDVTNRQEMQRQLLDATQIVNLSDRDLLIKAQTRLVDFDNEYTQLLQEALATSNVGPYETWIDENYLEALWAAKTMAEVWGGEMQQKLQGIRECWVDELENIPTLASSPDLEAF